MVLGDVVAVDDVFVVVAGGCVFGVGKVTNGLGWINIVIQPS